MGNAPERSPARRGDESIYPQLRCRNPDCSDPPERIEQGGSSALLLLSIGKEERLRMACAGGEGEPGRGSLLSSPNPSSVPYVEFPTRKANNKKKKRRKRKPKRSAVVVANIPRRALPFATHKNGGGNPYVSQTCST
uniref:Uncharacterized protein n=1 Tax=Oryza meridionalis TaxID=40149 RepID=A0A0E0F2E7_9ORYZ